MSFVGTPMSTGIHSLVRLLLTTRGGAWQDVPPQTCLDWLLSHHYDVTKSDKNRRAVHQQLLEEQARLLEEQATKSVSVLPVTPEYGKTKDITDLLPSLPPEPETEPLEQEADAIEEDIIAEADEVGAALDEAFFRIAKERKRKT